MLRESSECFCEFVIYGNAVETAWGMAPLRLKSSIPIADISAVETVGSKNTNGKFLVSLLFLL